MCSVFAAWKLLYLRLRFGGALVDGSAGRGPRRRPAQTSEGVGRSVGDRNVIALSGGIPAEVDV